MPAIPIHATDKQATTAMMPFPFVDRLPALLLAAACAVASASAQASCKVSPTLWDFKGQIGARYNIGMSLAFGESAIDGDYFYASQRKNIGLRGSLHGGAGIKLTEFDARGEASADFELTASNDCSVLDGVWRKRGAAESLPVHLAMTGGGGGSLAHRYSKAGADDDAIVHQGAVRFWAGVRDANKQAVAAQIRYPVKASIRGVKRQVKNRAELLANYDAIFTRAYRDSIVEAVPHNMFSNWQGIMLGQGAVWFNADGKVIALNN